MWLYSFIITIQPIFSIKKKVAKSATLQRNIYKYFMMKFKRKYCIIPWERDNDKIIFLLILRRQDRR